MDSHTRLYSNGRFVVMPNPPSPFAHLDADITCLVGEGLSDPQIGERLGLSARQVRGQRERLGLSAAHRQGRPRRGWRVS